VQLNTIHHWLGGKRWIGDAHRRAPVWNPSTGKQQAWVALADSSEVDRAVRIAAEAFQSWSQVSLSRRTKILFAFRELLSAKAKLIARAVSEEQGKVISDAEAEVQRGLEIVEYACGAPTLLKGEYSDQISNGMDLFSFREPLGVVVGITPFNFPAMVPIWMFPLAMACGNTFVLKPSERDPTASMVLAELLTEAGVPAGVFNVVHGDKATVEALLDHPDVAAISFVGSTPVAKYVYTRASAAGKRVQALGGAKNHAIILPDADYGVAADQLASAAFGTGGQRCMAVSAAVAVGSVGDDLVHAISAKAVALKIGPACDPASEMGPLVTKEAKERVTRLVGSAADQGATLAVDGRTLTVKGHEEGFYLGATVIDRVAPTMEVYREEVFGPVLSVVRVQTLKAAIELVNSNPYGNGTAIFTSSGAAAREFQRGVKVGMIGINVPIPVPMAYYSFGGWKASLFGDKHIQGPEGVSFYTRMKVVTSRWPQAEPATGATYRFPTAS
jgi:malonate-semialdehyde dehydrogenase (acetylating) / methylmalonate-semialdehyde dehydrogenase